MPGLLEETALLRTEVGKLCEFAKKGGASVGVRNGLQNEVLAVNRAVLESLPVV